MINIAFFCFQRNAKKVFTQGIFTERFQDEPSDSEAWSEVKTADFGSQTVDLETEMVFDTKLSATQIDGKADGSSVSDGRVQSE